MKPIEAYKIEHRGRLRLFLGKRYFSLRRLIKWQSEKHLYAIKKEAPLDQVIFNHQSVLLRQLRDVDMVWQRNKITNLKLASEKISRITILPGQVFSFWFLVGKTTKGKGYLKGMNLLNGKVSVDYGGGICQLGNLIYWMALHTPLKIRERWRHSYDVFPDVNRTLPFGSGATLSYNYIDLQLENTSDQSFQILLWLDNENLYGEIRSEREIDVRYEVYESDHIIRHEIWGGYTRHNRISRKVISKANDTIISDERVTENHAVMMYEPMLG
ncbi:MAG: vancomycin resistance protein [Bacteroidetes bacterium GWF2_38_335]|nr:MAG: vancomycin resistance protein [Bacteroidetes bacterium GWF2_38_335]OFY77442.1 MAG: vancomycin resistance protein [Bacteroidetes bacterium RIFOXYA12_FULL_38_20]HBS87269.1 vancomycin resistance protein [Bacteroidales bacterium]